MAFTINFYGDNPSNRAIAYTTSGAGTPTDQIFGPGSTELTFSGTISATSGSPTVTGSGTSFTTQVQVGQMFFGYVGSTPRLLGIVTAIGSNTSLTLGGNSPLTLSAVDYGAVNKINPVKKPFFMRVDVIEGDDPSLFAVPLLRQLRQGNTDNIGAFTDTDYLQLFQITASGTPGTEASPVNIPITIKRTNIIPTQGGASPVVVYSSLPEAFWYEITPVVSANPLEDQLASDASFQIFVETELPQYTVENDNTPLALSFNNTPGNTGGYF
jgi:hypothetical protein